MVSERAIRTFGKRLCLEFELQVRLTFLSRAYRFWENPDVPKTAALEVCIGYLWLVRGAQVLWPLFTTWVAPVGSQHLPLAPAALCGQCSSTTRRY